MGIMRTDSFVGSITRSRLMRPRSSAKTMPNSLNAGMEIEPNSFVANVVSLKRKGEFGKRYERVDQSESALLLCLCLVNFPLIGSKASSC